MSLISQRPAHWNDVVGQQRAIDVLHAVLRNQTFLTRGIILYGVLGVGKTTTAYLVARALMCKGTDPLGCGTCPSCSQIDQSGIDNHPDFTEHDGAVKSGVDAARELLEVSKALPNMGRRKVIVIDEAQFLSSEAWGAYLKDFEQNDTDSVFILVSNEIEKIKRTMTSRCIKVPFERVSNATMVGLLSKVATANSINYELAALEVIARHSKGIIRDAVQWLNTAAALGEIKPELVQVVIDTTLEDKCTELLRLIARKDQMGACKLADEIGLNALPNKIVENLLSIYSRAIWQKDGEDNLHEIYIGLPNVGAVTDILVKWSRMTLPADITAIIVFELLRTQPQAAAARAPGGLRPAIASSAPPPAPTAARKSSLAAFLDGEAI